MAFPRFADNKTSPKTSPAPDQCSGRDPVQSATNSYHIMHQGPIPRHASSRSKATCQSLGTTALPPNTISRYRSQAANWQMISPMPGRGWDSISLSESLSTRDTASHCSIGQSAVFRHNGMAAQHVLPTTYTIKLLSLVYLPYTWQVIEKIQTKRTRGYNVGELQLIYVASQLHVLPRWESRSQGPPKYICCKRCDVLS